MINPRDRNNPAGDFLLPVILKVPPDKKALSGKAQVTWLRQYARQAVALSARQSGLPVPGFEKDARGAPIAISGIYWSLTHKPGYVAGVAAEGPVGIDLEAIRPVRPALFYKVTDETERQLDEASDALFFRFWTAKEAVLKAVGAGLAGLSNCKIIAILDEKNLHVSCGGILWRVEHQYYDNHLISMVKMDKEIKWTLPGQNLGTLQGRPLC